MRLEDWCIISYHGTTRLCGNVFDNPNVKDGTNVVTSKPVLWVGDNTVVTYSGSKYKLGNPLEDYEKKFPNAFERLRKTIDNICAY